MLKIAITGNIASGKSLAEKFIGEKGYIVYDADKIAHDILNDLTEFYGYDIFTDGKPDRAKLSGIVFDNPDMMRKLEEFIHPSVKKMFLEIFEQNKNEKMIFISVPQLYEANFQTLFDKVIFVKCDDEIRLQRLIKRNNFTEEECKKRMAAQLPQEQKQKLADYVIENNSDAAAFEDAVSNILSELNALV